MQLSSILVLALTQLASALPAATAVEARSIDDLGLTWKKAVSKNGKPFEIGYFDTGASEKANLTARALTPFAIDVNWPVTDSCDWITTTSRVSSASAISRAAVCKNSNPIWTYVIWFTNTADYDYFFYDESGDKYECNTFINGDHYIQYNSNGADIIGISGN